jgi:hypothetical protein
MRAALGSQKNNIDNSGIQEFEMKTEAQLNAEKLDHNPRTVPVNGDPTFVQQTQLKNKGFPPSDVIAAVSKKIATKEGTSNYGKYKFLETKGKSKLTIKGPANHRNENSSDLPMWNNEGAFFERRTK